MNGMAGRDDEDSFFDDDFPDIADDVFRQLEQDAISFTQKDQASIGTRRQPSNHDRNVSRVQQNGVPYQRGPPIHQNNAHRFGQPMHKPAVQYANTDNFESVTERADSFETLTLDEDGLPLVVEEPLRAASPMQIDETTAREQWRAGRFAQSNHQATRQPPVQQSRPVLPQTFISNRNVQAPAAGLNQSRPLTTSNLLSDETLRNRIRDLEQSLDKANEEIITRRGEIATIRANQDAVSRAHQRELSTMKKNKQDDMDKQKVALEALLNEKTKVVDKVRFMQNDLDEASRRVQNLQRQIKERPAAEKPTNPNTTPKRDNRTLRDGFDDEDLIMVSPVKSGKRSKPSTPTANRKRKQPAGEEVVVAPLALRPSFSQPAAAVAPLPPPEKKSSVSGAIIRKEQNIARHLRLIQQVLALRTTDSEEVLTERLTHFSFPSNPKQTLSSMVMLETAKLAGPRLSPDLLQIFISLWSRALTEKYYQCISLLIEVITKIMDIDMCVIDAEVITSLLPVLESTAEINARARFYLIVKKDWLDNPSKKKPELNPQLNTTTCIQLLYTVALLISDDPDLLALFWRSLGTDFILMMLNACQPMRDVITILQLLSTSILPTTFGNICSPDQQHRMETYITDRICYLLWEQPKPLSPLESRPTRASICNLRLEALSLLERLTITSSLNPYSPSTATNHGTTFLARHITAIARLIRSIYEELENTYLLLPTQPLHAALVNKAVRIVHFVLSSPAGRAVELQTHLRGVNGAAHKYRVVLTRLAFREGVLIDRGIDDETVRLATELLEEGVTPDEAEDLLAVFNGGEREMRSGGRRGDSRGSESDDGEGGDVEVEDDDDG